MLKTNHHKKHQPQWIEIDGIRFYNETESQVSQSETKQIIVTPASLLHVTRHLTNLSLEARRLLLAIKTSPDGRVVNEQLINKQLSATGSKFNPKINNPEELLRQCKQIVAKVIESGQVASWLKENDEFLSAHLKISLNPEQKQLLGLNTDEPTGDIRVVPITKELQSKVRQEQRGKGEKSDQIIINVISGIEPLPTDNLIISIKKPTSGNPPEFITAYTGIIVPYLPNLDQSTKELAYNKDWWSRHAFIKND